MELRQRIRRGVLLLVVALVSTNALANTEVLSVNLNPLIDRAAGRPSQFAVDVAHKVSSATAGRWQVVGRTATWTYGIRIPGAVSLSFHATRVTLPAGGTLTMSAGGETYRFAGRDLHRPDFWSRVGLGDELDLQMTVPLRMRRQALLEIGSFQAGYRSLAPGQPDNPHYKILQQRRGQATAAASSTCVENYACDATGATQEASHSSVAVIVANQYACSGTLVNDVAQDGAPYILTARHCENGTAAGGDPAAAANVAVYWDAVAACGSLLPSIFNAAAPYQYGAATVVEQQDVWLIRLASLPAASDAYYSGWDATPTAPVGGYSIHYANADTQQFVTWAGTAVARTVSAATLGVGYSTTFWELVNSLGSVDHGASGAALFSSGNAVVGVLSRAAAAQCPVIPPPAPSDTTVVALAEDLSTIWSATSDTTSSTGTTTLASTLDPGGTGTLTMSGISGSPSNVFLNASQTAAQTGTTVNLYFSASAGATCTATGGLAGDGWTGSIAAAPSGTKSLTETTTGAVTYGLVCTSGARSAQAQVTIEWTLAPPSLSIGDSAIPPLLYAGMSDTISWQSNQSSCTASGGSSGDGWGGTVAGSGQITVTESRPGSYSYTLTCGSGAQAIAQSLSIMFQTPTSAVSIMGPPPSTLRIGQAITLQWSGSNLCQASGGGAGDGWSIDPSQPYGYVNLTETVPGTYTYTITCGPAGATAVATVSETFTSDPPTATLTAPQAQIPVVLVPAALPPPNLTWLANVQPCSIDYTGPVNGSLLSGWLGQGSWRQGQQIAGTYTYTLTCGSGADQATSTATITWLQPPPQVTLAAPGPEEILPGTLLNWTTNVLPCTGAGGTPGDGWTGPLTYGAFGPSSMTQTLVSEPTTGTYTFTLTCGVGPYGTAQATVVFNNPAGSQLTLAASSNSIYTGQPLHLTWNSALSPCTGYGGTAGDGWDSTHPSQGSADVYEPAGTYNLSLVCGSGAQAVEAQVFVSVTQVTQVVINWGLNSHIGVVGRSTTLAWDANGAASCVASGGVQGDGWSGPQPISGSIAISEAAAGADTYTLSCQNGSLTDQSSWTTQWILPPSVTLAASVTNVSLGVPFTLTWSSTGATMCSGLEDNAPGPWLISGATSGTATVEETQGSSHTYTVVCTGDYASAQAQVTVNFLVPPTATISASATNATVGQSVMLQWSSTNATSCQASGGASGDGWSGPEPASSNGVPVTERTPGTYTYDLTCNGNGASAYVATSVTFNASSSGGGGGGGGGGGDLDLYTLIGLALMSVTRWRCMRRGS